MTDLTKAPATDPVSVYRHRDALYASDMLIAALKGLDFFTWMADEPQTPASICEHFGFHPRPVATDAIANRGFSDRIDVFASNMLENNRFIQAPPRSQNPGHPTGFPNPLTFPRTARQTRCSTEGNPAFSQTRRTRRRRVRGPCHRPPIRRKAAPCRKCH